MLPLLGSQCTSTPGRNMARFSLYCIYQWQCCWFADAQLQRWSSAAIPPGGAQDSAPHYSPLLGVQNHLGLDDTRADLLHVRHGAVPLHVSPAWRHVSPVDVTSYLLTSHFTCWRHHYLLTSDLTWQHHILPVATITYLLTSSLTCVTWNHTCWRGVPPADVISHSCDVTSRLLTSRLTCWRHISSADVIITCWRQILPDNIISYLLQPEHTCWRQSHLLTSSLTCVTWNHTWWRGVSPADVISHLTTSHLTCWRHIAPADVISHLLTSRLTCWRHISLVRRHVSPVNITSYLLTSSLTCWRHGSPVGRSWCRTTLRSAPRRWPTFLCWSSTASSTSSFSSTLSSISTRPSSPSLVSPLQILALFYLLLHHTSFVGPSGEIVSDPKIIRANYLKSYFYLVQLP